MLRIDHDDDQAILPAHEAMPTLRSGGVEVNLTANGGLALAIRVHGRPTIHRLSLGVRLTGAELGASSRVLRTTEREFTEQWTPRSGKLTLPHSAAHREAVITLLDPSGLEWQVIVRVARDGIAVRYAVPELQGHGRFEADRTALELPTSGRAWVLDYQTWYETPRRGVDLADVPDGDYGFPFVYTMDGAHYVLVTESDIDGRFSGSHAELRAGRLHFTPADDASEVVRGALTPWRVILVGSLADVVESLFVDELAPPTRTDLVDAAWVRPGRAAWSWWSGFYSGAQPAQQRAFIDFAAEHGWEHLLVDCGWEDTWVPELVAYASARGIQVHLWCVWHDLDGPQKLDRLALWRSWGVAGIKVDFMESESKDRYRWYDSVLRETARLGLMVNFHGSVIPRGWARTWPHVMSYEAIRGSEYYVFFEGTPLTSEHNVIQPFTRNVVGAMDYTPVAFTAPGRQTSDGHELALSVVFESGITHFAEHIDELAHRPLVSRFLAELPAQWHETLLLSGTPDSEAVLARRAGDRWFIGGIATGPARMIRVPLDRLGMPQARVWVINDSEAGLVESLVDGDHGLDVMLAEHGGFVAIVGADPSRITSVSRGVEPLQSIEPALAELVDGAADLITDPNATLRVPPGWHAHALGDGRWRVTAPPLRSGAVGVIAAERPGRHGIPVVAHSRVAAPIKPGTHHLSDFAMLRFENESGPVERNTSNGGGNPRDGSRMSIAGTQFDDGFGVSTPSIVDLHLGGRAARLTGFVGIDDETPGTTATAVVLGDGVELVRLDIDAGRPAVELDLDADGIQIVTLRTEPRGEEPAHVDWAALRVTADTPNHG